MSAGEEGEGGARAEERCLISTTATRPCRRCQQATEQEISRRIATNGTEHYAWFCLKCRWWTEKRGGGIWISTEDLTSHGVDLSLLPTAESLQSNRCVRCGARNAELHHWAPKAFFGDDADRWPQDYLCRPCHLEWHDRVTPGLVHGASAARKQS